MKEQWSRYRKEIERLLQDHPDMKDYFSEATIEEIENRIPFEGCEE